MMNIALNKTYLTKDKKEFSPIKTRRGDKIFEIRNMLGSKVWKGRYEIIFVDKDGNEYQKHELLKEVKLKSN